MDYYFLIAESAEDLTAIRTDCFARHAAATNNQNDLSERLSRSGAERLIKVAGVDQEWLDGRIWNPASVIWQFADGDEIGETVRHAWSEAQERKFDGDDDTQPDTEQQRRDYWFNIWQNAINP